MYPFHTKDMTDQIPQGLPSNPLISFTRRCILLYTIRKLTRLFCSTQVGLLRSINSGVMKENCICNVLPVPIREHPFSEIDLVGIPTHSSGRLCLYLG